jgi:hypothetical protein
MAIQTGLELRLTVDKQPVLIHMEDVAKVKSGQEAFQLQIPGGSGVNIALKDLLTFLSTNFHFQETDVPQNIRDFLDKTSITLNELSYKASPGNDSSGKPIPADFRVSVTVKFVTDPDPTKGGPGLLSELIGVDMSSIIDIDSITFVLTQGNWTAGGSQSALPAGGTGSQTPPAAPTSGGTTKQ